MRLVSWNVNGINASIKKGLLDFMKKEKADVYCFQETRSPKKVESSLLELEGYEQYWHYAEKKGYSGTVTLTRVEPLSVKNGLGRFDTEGRTITTEFNDFYLVNVYFPNASRELVRLDYKMEYNKRFQRYTQRLRKKKPVVVCGDFNVSHKEIDLARPKNNRQHAGFTDEERQWFDRYLKKGYIDSFREFVKEGGHYTWWFYMFDARAKNVGWRLDYFVISEELRPRLVNSEILKEVMGSDHCPIRLTLK